MAFSKHNIEKHHLIELVKRNPILWDCRLPHYKRSDKKKDIKWSDLGRAFNVSGARVQRTFTSMREIFRRELSHEKLLGDRFRSKWEFYDEMCFLKDVIRERKSRGFHVNMSNENGYSSEHMDGNNSFEPHVQVLLNNNNVHHHNNHHHTNGLYKEKSENNNNHINNNSSNNSNNNHTTTNTSINVAMDDHNNNTNHDNNAPSSSCSSSPPSLRIKSESPENVRNTQNVSDNSDYEQDFPRISLLPQNHNHMSQRHHRNISRHADEDEDLDEETVAPPSTILKKSPREIYYSKFGEFLTARLNVLSDDKANDLVSKILLLMAQHE